MVNKKQKMKELNNIIEVVLIRIPREIEARTFYISASQRFSSSTAKELFKELALQEAGHEAELRRILNDLQEELRVLKDS